MRTSVYSPPNTTRKPSYYVKNLDILLGVTNTEDFPMQELVQRNLASGAMPELVYGKMEPALAGYHTAINERLAAPPAGTGFGPDIGRTCDQYPDRNTDHTVVGSRPRRR